MRFSFSFLHLRILTSGPSSNGSSIIICCFINVYFNAFFFLNVNIVNCVYFGFHVNVP